MNMPSGGGPAIRAVTTYERFAYARAKNPPRSRNGISVATTTSSAISVPRSVSTRHGSPSCTCFARVCSNTVPPASTSSRASPATYARGSNSAWSSKRTAPCTSNGSGVASTNVAGRPACAAASASRSISGRCQPALPYRYAARAPEAALDALADQTGDALLRRLHRLPVAARGIAAVGEPQQRVRAARAAR